MGEKSNSGDIVNPIDPDKVSDSPGLLEYAHHVGSAIIRPEDRGKLKSQSLSAMYEQTNLQLEQIKKQIELLAQQAKQIQDRKQISEMIYATRLSFKPVIGHTYHLYRKENGDHVLSLLGPSDWGRSQPDWSFVSSVKLLGDHTWEILESDD